MTDTQLVIDQAAVAAEILAGTTPDADTTAPAMEEQTSTEQVEAAPATEETAASESTPDETQPEPKVLDPISELIEKKYGGDKTKMFEGWVELMNSGSKQHKKIESLEAKISELLDQITQPTSQHQAILEDSPEIKGLKQELADIDSEVQYAQTQQNGLLDGITKGERELARLEGRMEKADDFDKGLIRQDILSKQNELRALAQEFRSLEKERKQATSRKQSVSRQLEAQTRNLQEQVSKQRQAELDNATYRKEFLQDFSAEVDKVAGSVGFATDGEERAWLYKLVKADAREFLETNPNSSIDPETFVPQRAEYHLRISGLSKRSNFAKLAADKAAITTPGAPAKPVVTPGKPPAPNQLPAGKMTPAQARAWTQRVLG